MQWTDEQRLEALTLLAEYGKAEASRRTGIPAGTIASWGARHNVKAPLPEQLRQVTEKRLATIAERKATLAEGLAVTAQWLLDEARTEELAIDRKRTVEAVARAVETVQLLTGEATERIEQIGGGSTVEAAKAVLADVRERHLKAVG